MSKKANPTMVGAFVLTALGLIVGAVLFLGRFTLHNDSIRCVAYFTGSLHGLDVGAPVAFRGVTVGKVSNIRLRFDQKTNNYIIPVYIDISHPASIDNENGNPDTEEVEAIFQRAVQRGLRAQLRINSLLTGKLYVDLDFFKNSELSLHNTDNNFFEIPTKTSGLEEIAEQLQNLPLSEILNKVANALDNLDALLNSEESGKIIKSLGETMGYIKTILAATEKDYPDLSTKLKHTLENFAALGSSANTFMHSLQKNWGTDNKDLQHILQNLNIATISFNKILDNIETITAPNSPYSYQLLNALQEIEKAAASISDLSSYLQQHPSSVVFGRGKDKE